MNKQLSVIIGGAALLVVVLGAWILAPRLRGPSATVQEQVESSAEKARRLADQYEWALEVGARKTEQAGLSENLTGEKLSQLAEADNQTVAANLEAEAERLKEYVRATRSQVQALDEELRKLDPDAEISPPPSTGFSANAPGMAADMQKGLAGREQLVAQSLKAHASALSAVQEGLSASAGEVSGTDSIVGNRVKGMMLFQQGLSQYREAATLRQQALQALRDVATAAAPLEQLRRGTAIVQASDIDATVKRHEEAVAEAEAKQAAEQAALGELDERIAALRQEIDRELARAEAARARMEELELRGIRYEQADAAAQFRTQYMEQAAIYREAAARAQALQFGTLRNAQIDATGDFLKGEFVSISPDAPIEYVPGLDELERERVRREAAVASWGQRVEEARKTLARVSDLQGRYAQRASGAAADVQATTQRIQEAFARFQEQKEAAAQATDKAVGTLRNAASAFSAAQRAAREYVNSAPADLSPTAMELSPYRLIQDDRWIGGQLQCQQGDAQLRAAMALYEHYVLLSDTHDLLSKIAAVVTLPEYDAGALEQSVADTKTAGEELADKAVDAYESAANDLKRHWTVAASAAAADYVYALFGHPDMVDIALANYRAVIEGREDDPLVRPFRERFDQLKNR